MPYDVVAYESDDAAMQLTEAEEGLFHRMLRRSWMNGSIPADLQKLTPICRTNYNRLKKAWKRISLLWIPHPDLPDRLINPKQESERAWVVQKSVAATESAVSGWKVRKAKNNANANALQTQSDRNASPPLPIPKGNTEEERDPPTPPNTVSKPEGKQVVLEEAKPVKPERPKDEPYELFVKLHDERFNPAVYHRDQTADFVRLAALRKDHKLEARASPPKWEEACRNYFATLRRKYSLADLASNYALFVQGPLDRFGKLMNVGNGAGTVHGVKVFKGGGRTLDSYDDDGDLRQV